jgi:hypothetical protein
MSLAITNLSPREAVLAGQPNTKKGELAYKVPSTVQAITAGLYSISKIKKISILEEEA